MKSKALIGIFQEMVRDGTLDIKDWDFMRNLAENEARTFANDSYGIPPKSSSYFSLKSLQSKLKNHRKAYETELSKQLEWRYNELGRGNVLVYSLGKNRERVISLHR